jgi:diguanylate cyclase (GGDEF)-like protein
MAFRRNSARFSRALSTKRRGGNGLKTEDDRSTGDRDHSASDDDQTLSDFDQTASDSDQMASDRDQNAAARDQRTADREQEAADAAFRAGEHPALYLATKSEREMTAHGREITAQDRDATASARLLVGTDRDAVARARDEAAALRDRIAAARDEEARIQDEAAEALVRGASQVDEVRAQWIRDRARAAADREIAARDRELAAFQRAQAAREREQAARDRELAATDPLTGVRARGAGLADLQHEIDRARRTGDGLVLAFADVDHLKAVNDSEGHPAGDELLREIAGTLRERVRSYDVVMRFGGDEFICALSGVSIDEAQRRFEKPIVSTRGTPAGHALSIGFAELTEEDDLDSLIARADDSLLRTRRS